MSETDQNIFNYSCLILLKMCGTRTLIMFVYLLTKENVFVNNSRTVCKYISQVTTHNDHEFYI